MNLAPNYLTKTLSDWESYLSTIRQVLEEAEYKVYSKADPEQDSVFSCPNRAIMTGMVRFWEVNHHLERACSIGMFGTITAKWERLSGRSGGFHELVLHGAHTTMSAVHLSEPNETPRSSVRRAVNRHLNYQLPLFEEFPELEEVEGEIHLTLVHGGKEEKFAFLRLYFDPEYPNRYIQITSNLMNLPVVLQPVEAEHVQEAEVAIKPHVIKKNEDSTQ